MMFMSLHCPCSTHQDRLSSEAQPCLFSFITHLFMDSIKPPNLTGSLMNHSDQTAATQMCGYTDM